jgi:hypothetical protein
VPKYHEDGKYYTTPYLARVIDVQRLEHFYGRNKELCVFDKIMATWQHGNMATLIHEKNVLSFNLIALALY